MRGKLLYWFDYFFYMNGERVYVLCGISPIGWHQNLTLCQFICLRVCGGWGCRRTFGIFSERGLC